LDLNGSWLFTNTTLGPEDPNVTQNIVTYPPLWNDWSGSDTVNWPRHRVVIRVVADDVRIYSSIAGARIQGAARKVFYRADDTNLPEGCEFNSTYEGQAGVRFGYNPSGTPQPRARFDLDLTNIAIEYVSGDGIYLMDETSDVTIHGARQGVSVVDANVVNTAGDVELGATGGLGGTINTSGAYHVWTPTFSPIYPGIHHTARQGIAFPWDHANITIRDLSIWRVGRSAIDMEITSGFHADTVTIQRVEFGHWYLGMISNGSEGTVDNLTVEDCYSYKQWLLSCHTNGASPDRPVNWLVQRNRAELRHNSASGSPNVLDRVDGLDVLDNYGLTRSSGQGVDPGTSTDVTVSPGEDIQYPPTSQTVVCPAFAGVAAATGQALTPTIPR
jgi:hypothetical protein